MPVVTVPVSAAIGRIAATLAPVVTNSIISDVASAMGVANLDGTNKPARLRSLLTALWLVGSRTRVERCVASLVMAAHDRAASGQGEMTEDDVDSVVADMKPLGLDPGQLALRGWRRALRKHATPTAPAPRTGTEVPATSSQTPPRPYPDAVEHLRQLVAPSISPHLRGHQLETIVYDVLLREQLGPRKNIRIPGEEIDLAFVLDGQHYLVECKWEQQPVGLAAVTLFAGKVSKKAEGTFGVVLSMSGFVGDINEKASRGGRLNCIGVTAQQFMLVLDGRTTWGQLVRQARMLASTTSVFLPEP